MFKYICRQYTVFPNNSGRIRSIKLEIVILYHIKNTFTSTHQFLDICLWDIKVSMQIRGKMMTLLIFF